MLILALEEDGMRMYTQFTPLAAVEQSTVASWSPSTHKLCKELWGQKEVETQKNTPYPMM